MSAHKKKIRPAAAPLPENPTRTGTHQTESARLTPDEPDIKTSLKNRARMMLDTPAEHDLHDDTEIQLMQSQDSISTLYQTLTEQSLRTSQMCMDAELRAIAAIEERITAELRLIEADFSCIGMEVRARTAIAEKLQEAAEAVAAAITQENAVMNELDSAGPVTGIGETSPGKQHQVNSHMRLNAELRARKMQRIRMEAEQCAIQEIESQVAQDDSIAHDQSRQCLSEDAILQMAQENGMLATQVNVHSAEGDLQAQNTIAESEAHRLLDNIRNSTWQTFHMGSPTLH